MIPRKGHLPYILVLVIWMRGSFFLLTDPSNDQPLPANETAVQHLLTHTAAIRAVELVIGVCPHGLIIMAGPCMLPSNHLRAAGCPHPDFAASEY